MKYHGFYEESEQDMYMGIRDSVVDLLTDSEDKFQVAQRLSWELIYLLGVSKDDTLRGRLYKLAYELYDIPKEENEGSN